jgi:hypothetical protein
MKNMAITKETSMALLSTPITIWGKLPFLKKCYCRQVKVYTILKYIKYLPPK